LVLGSLLIPPLTKRLRRRSAGPFGAGVAVLAGCALLITLAHALVTRAAPTSGSRAPSYVGAVLLLTLCMGIGLDLVTIPAQATMQELAPDWIKGRVLALQTVLLNAVTVPAVFGVGLAADHLGGLSAALDVLAVAVLTGGSATLIYARRARVRSPVGSRRAAAQIAGETERAPLAPTADGRVERAGNRRA
jgi:hypothetical protein